MIYHVLFSADDSTSDFVRTLVLHRSVEEVLVSDEHARDLFLSLWRICRCKGRGWAILLFLIFAVTAANRPNRRQERLLLVHLIKRGVHTMRSHAQHGCLCFLVRSVDRRRI